MCAKHDAVITSIETLHSGGTRVVLTNGDGAARVRRAYGSKVITTAVQRLPMRVEHSPYASRAASEAEAQPRGGASPVWKPRS
jgi:hypothetical protein